MSLLVLELSRNIIVPHRGVLILLIFAHQIVQVALRLGELHLVHALPGVPMQEGLTTEHDGKLLGHPLPRLLNAGGVSDEDARHLHSHGGNVADAGLEVVGNPFDKVSGIFGDHFEHLVVHLLAGHGTAEHHGARQVTSVARVGGAHHVLGVERLLGELRDAEDAEVVRALGGEGGESHEEEVEAGEGDHVHGELAEVAVQLSGEAEGAGGPGDGRGDEVVEIAVGGVGEFEGAEADVVQGLVVQGEALVGVLDQLVNRQGGVVRFHDRVGHLGRRHDAVGGHDTIRKLLPDLGNQQRSHAGPRPSPHGMRDLEPLEHVARLGLLPRHVHDGVDQLGALGVVSLGPVVPRAGLAEDEVVRSEDAAEGPGADGVHGAGFEVGEDGAGDVAALGGLVEVDVDALELEVAVALVGAVAVDAVLHGHYLPKFRPNLVSTLSCLKMNDFSHD
mmetsp:Transcript_41418/g.86943  ORF Transcript_41418/g.86943 Transcript_41418/m.86943 type:complete len:447 (+) Transcript_41418:339-1679(+)